MVKKFLTGLQVNLYNSMIPFLGGGDPVPFFYLMEVKNV